MIQRATSRNMGPQGWRPLLSPKPTDPLTTLVGKYAHILCLLHLLGRFSLLIQQQDQGVRWICRDSNQSAGSATPKIEHTYVELRLQLKP